MPQFKEQRTIKKVNLPQIEGAEVELYNTLLWGDVESLYGEESSDLQKGTKALVKLIKDWNLTDEKGEKLPITEETLKKFRFDVVNHLLQETDFSKLGANAKETLKKKI
jgi:hypothetical protein